MWNLFSAAPKNVLVSTRMLSASRLLINFRRKSHQLLHNKRVETLGYVEFGPVGNALIYYYGGDLYYMENMKDVARRITFNGAVGIYQNGIPDWIYEGKLYCC